MGQTKVLRRFTILAILLVLVEVYAVPISLAIQGLEAKQIIKDIIKQNYTIVGVKRLVQKRLERVQIGEKVKLLLIIGVQLKKVVNRLFNQGLFLGGDYYLVIRYKMTFLVTQYFKYQGFNYIAKSCRREARYRYYTRWYNTSDYIGGLPKKYINYKVGYKVQNRIYSIKRTQQEKAIVIIIIV